MNSKIQEAVDVVAAKWARLREVRTEQVQAQARLEAITEKTMEAGARYEEAVEALARVAREYPDPPVPPEWKEDDEARRVVVAACANCGHQIHYTPKYSGWFHSDGRSQCLSDGGTNATPVPDAE